MQKFHFLAFYYFYGIFFPSSSKNPAFTDTSNNQQDLYATKMLPGRPIFVKASTNEDFTDVVNIEFDKLNGLDFKGTIKFKLKYKNKFLQPRLILNKEKLH